MTTDKVRTNDDQLGQELSAASTSPSHTEIAMLIKTQYSGLLSLVRRKLKDRELAADLVNEAIAITLDHANHGRLTQLASLGGYVFKVTLNLLRNYQRNHDNRLDIRADITALDSLTTYDSDGVEASQIRQRTESLIHALSSPRDRRVVKRFYLDEIDKESICAELGLTPLQFTQIMSRARQRMKLIFESQGFKRSDFLSFAL